MSDDAPHAVRDAPELADSSDPSGDIADVSELVDGSVAKFSNAERGKMRKSAPDRTANTVG